MARTAHCVMSGSRGVKVVLSIQMHCKETGGRLMSLNFPNEYHIINESSSECAL